jgi:hypothetical protein
VSIEIITVLFFGSLLVLLLPGQYRPDHCGTDGPFKQVQLQFSLIHEIRFLASITAREYADRAAGGVVINGY